MDMRQTSLPALGPDPGVTCPARPRPAHRRRGVALFWAVAIMAAVLGSAALAVDWGAVQLAESELQGAVDAATLYGIRGMDQDYTVAKQRVLDSLAENKVNGRAIPAAAVTVEFGVWDPKLKTFAVLTGKDQNSGTAMRVTVKLTGNQGAKGIFSSMFGTNNYGVLAKATATRGQPVNVDIDAKASPYLAGMPDGSKINFTGSSTLSWKKDASYAPDCSPEQVMIPVVPGQVLYFRDVEGSTGDYQSGLTYGLEGNLSRPKMAQEPVNGFNTTYAPLNSLMGVFLDDNKPTSGSMRDKLDFSTQASRDFDQLTMQTKQIFFVGDGVNNTSGKLQKFVVPPGATRLFLGLSDELGFWWDNFGSYRTTVFYGEVKLVE